MFKTTIRIKTKTLKKQSLRPTLEIESVCVHKTCAHCGRVLSVGFHPTADEASLPSVGCGSP